MKGFKNTKTGPIYGDFNLSGGTPMIGNTMPQRFARGGLVGRVEPSNELDAESGGKTPLRPGYNRGGKAKTRYAEGGKVNSAVKAVKKRMTREELHKLLDDKRAAAEAEFQAKRKEAASKLKPAPDLISSSSDKNFGPIRRAEGGKVGALQAALKAKPAVKAVRDGMAKDVKMDKANDKAGYDARRKAFFESRRSQRPPSSGPATRDTRTGRFAKGGMVGCGFNRKPMIGN